MFEDESKPLYKLCRKLKLERIAATDYKEHINKLALATWKQEFPDETFQEIMHLSNRHPYYVNYLCDIVWSENEKLPNIDNIRQAWNSVVDEEWSDALKEISVLSLSQRKILKFIANQHETNLLSHETTRELRVPASTISSAIETLIQKDYLEIDDDHRYRIISPLLATLLAQDQS